MGCNPALHPFGPQLLAIEAHCGTGPTDRVSPVSHLSSRDQSARKRCWAVRNDPICCRRQAFNRHGRWWVEPFFIAGAIFACADKHGTAEPCAQGSCDVGLSVITDHYGVFRRAVHARKRGFKNSGAGFPKISALCWLANSSAATNVPASKLSRPSASLKERFFASAINWAPSISSRNARLRLA